MRNQHCSTPLLNLLMMLASFIVIALLSGCASDSHTAKGAGQGATTGAISGAVGGLVSALVFGGDPAEAAARGAVYGGAVGATAGAMSGSTADRKAEQGLEAKLEALRAKIGDETYKGLEALAECRHDVSLKHAKASQQSDNPNYSLAGLWLEVLTYADEKDESRARSLFPELVEKDWNIKSEVQAEEKMRSALNALMGIREEYGLSRVC